MGSHERASAFRRPQRAGRSRLPAAPVALAALFTSLVLLPVPGAGAPLAPGTAASRLPEARPDEARPDALLEAPASRAERPPAGQPHRDVEIIINLPAFRLYLYEDGHLLKSYPIGIGQAVQPTILGSTEVINRVPDPVYYPLRWWERAVEPIPPGPDNPVGTRWIGLGIPHYGIHGTNLPETIGTMASLGCIRMYNRDVEELYERVRIGTPVLIIYETLLTWRDEEGQPWVKVHRDIYARGTNTSAAAFWRLSRLGLPPEAVFIPALQELLARADGRPHPVPLVVPVRWEGRPGLPGFREGRRIFLPVAPLARAVGARLTWQEGRLYVAGTAMPRVRRYPHGLYAPAQALVQALGLGGRVGPDGADLYGPPPLARPEPRPDPLPSGTPAPAADFSLSASSPDPPPGVPDPWDGVPAPVIVYHTYATQNLALNPPHATGGQPGDVVAVGEALTAALRELGLEALHLTEAFDYPAYGRGPDNARAALRAWLTTGPAAAIVDVRRDALATDFGEGYVTAWFDGRPTARLLLVVGDSDNPNAQANAAFAEAVRQALEQTAPGLTRGVRVFHRRYHGDLHPRSLVAFFGEHRYTTMEQAGEAARLLARSIAAALAPAP